MKRLATQFGKGETFRLTPVGVFFGPGPGVEVPDPYFGGVGPSRRGCLECGSCMTGCRNNAKNTLVKNYLALAERGGAEILPLTTVTNVRALPGGGYTVDTVRTGRPSRRPERTFTATHVIFAAGTYGTQTLLHRLKATTLPRISDRLGRLTRTNSESLLGAVSRDPKADYTHGVAITSSWHPDQNTHIEPVRYGKGSNAMGLLCTAMTDGGTRRHRWGQWLQVATRHPQLILATIIPRRWSEKTIILLVMQSLSNSITVRRSRRGRLTSVQGEGEPNPTWIPVANRAARGLAANIGGVTGGTWGDLFNIPMTAHFIGGCPIGDSPETGVIDPYHRLYGYEGLSVVDGSALTANLGVNPALSITAQAERAMSLWPNRDEPDRRPPLGAPYRRIPATFPHRPIVPADAPAALSRDDLGLLDE